MPVRVTTTKFTWSHGRQPRGRGLWAFAIGGQTRFISGTYREAKKQALAEARTKGVQEIFVLP
jgi:hypothetical protein